MSETTDIELHEVPEEHACDKLLRPEVAERIRQAEEDVFIRGCDCSRRYGGHASWCRSLL